MRGVRLLALLGVLSAVGCAGPRASIPARARSSPPERWMTTPASGAVPDESSWLGAFSDPALTQLVQSALQGNLDLEISAQRVLQARAQFRQARGQQGPTLIAAGGGFRERDINPAFGVPETQRAGEVELSASYDVDLFGRLAEATAAARASMLATESASRTVRIAIVCSVVDGYIGLLALDARLELLKTTAHAREEELHFAQRRVQAGYAPAIDEDQAQAAYQAAVQLLTPTRLAVERQEHGLSLLLGENPHAISRGVQFSHLQAPIMTASVPAEVLRRRPDVREAELRLVAADHSLDSARASFMPSVQLSASGGWVTSTLLEHNPNAVFSLGGSILAPIFEAGRLKAQRDFAAARRDEAAFAYRKAVLSAFRDVEDTLSAAQLYEEQQTSLNLQQEALSRALQRASNRYRAGYSPYLEQIDAERNLLAAQLSVLQSRLDWLTSLVSLYQSVGGNGESEKL